MAVALVATLTGAAVRGGGASTASTVLLKARPGAGSQLASSVGTGATWAAATSAAGFADQVLASAPVLPGARPWRGKVPSVLGQAPMGVGGTSDLHRFYLVSGATASELPGYVTDHLPKAKLESSGLGSQLDEFLFVLPHGASTSIRPRSSTPRRPAPESLVRALALEPPLVPPACSGWTR